MPKHPRKTKTKTVSEDEAEATNLAVVNAGRKSGIRKLTMPQRTLLFFTSLGLLLVLISPKASLGFRFLGTFGFLVAFAGSAFIVSGDRLTDRLDINADPFRLGHLLLLSGGLVAILSILFFPAVAPYTGALGGFPFWYWIFLFMSALIDLEMGFVGLLASYRLDDRAPSSAEQ